MKNSILNIFIALSLAFSLNANDKIKLDETQEWFALYFKKNFKRVEFLNDFNVRVNISSSKLRTLALRSVGNYYLKNKNSKVGIGSAVFLNSIFGNFNFNNEFRLFEDISFAKQIKKVKFTFSFRDEQRYFFDTKTLVNRARLKTEIFISVFTLKGTKPKNGVFINNELFVQTEKSGKSYVEQNRLALGISYYFSANFAAQFSYVYLPIVRKSTNAILQRQIFRLNFNLDF